MFDKYSILTRMVTVAVQAGGESRRMGRNKALMPFLGRPLIERVVERVRLLGDEIILTTNEPEAFAWLGLRAVSDLYPGVGALAGLHTALATASHPEVLVVACDMPFVSAELLREELRLLRNEGIDAVVPDSGEGYEPFHAAYRREPCLAAVEAALQAGQRRMISWFPAARVRILSAAEVNRFDPRGVAFLNANTPEEFERCEALAHAEGDQSPAG
jgi:molybdopterin-guanine dinucleotide biosynthesis protein A